MTRALYTLIVGVIVMLAVPVSQLRFASVRVECCCPDPEQCKCPDHEKQKPGQTTMQACHKKSDAIANASASVFDVPERIALDNPVTRIIVVTSVAPEPHDPPDPARPPRPS